AHTQQFTTFTSTASGSDPGGPGAITFISQVPYGGATNITANDPFMIIWFESGTAAGNKYGTLENNSATGKFIIPADGTTLESSYAAFFAGSTADPVRK